MSTNHGSLLLGLLQRSEDHLATLAEQIQRQDGPRLLFMVSGIGLILGTLLVIWSMVWYPVDPDGAKNGQATAYIAYWQWKPFLPLWLSLSIMLIFSVWGVLVWLGRAANRSDTQGAPSWWVRLRASIFILCLLLVTVDSWGHGLRQLFILLLLAPFVGILLTGFFLVASNFRPLASKVEEKLVERLDHGIASIASDLMQSNLSVAALHIRLGNKIDPTPVPEYVLREMDDALHIKHTMASLEKVMQARQRHVQSSIHHLKEQQQRARRAVTAGAGGIFVGYFTYEAGEAVLKYIHVAGRADDRDLHYWLQTDATHQTRTEQPSSSKIEEVYKDRFHHHELLGQAWLLTITLTVSLLAGWLGWRKPPEEQAGGHGSHH